MELYVSKDLPYRIYVSRSSPVKASPFSGISALMLGVVDMEFGGQVPKKQIFRSSPWLVLHSTSDNPDPFVATVISC
jgi:hypothetical protein